MRTPLTVILEMSKGSAGRVAPSLSFMADVTLAEHALMATTADTDGMNAAMVMASVAPALTPTHPVP